MKKVLMSLIVILILGLVGGVVFYKKALNPVDINSDEVISLVIDEGSSGSIIGEKLKKENLISSSMAFKIYIRKNKINDLKSGEYNLSKSMDLPLIVENLRQGGKTANVDVITIPEGYEIKQIAKKLSEEGLVDELTFIERASNKNNFQTNFTFLDNLEDNQTLEGYLFPSTYEIPKGSSEDEIISMMVERFEKVYEESIKKDEKNVDLDFNEIVTLASIIERESRRDDERAKISAVFHNRLKDDMRLQSCATVQYILGERKEILSTKDTRIESDYNTYLYTGLPPTPISSVGKESLIAAVNPEDVDYLFFRTKEDGSGGHTFSKTFEEHKKAKPNK